MLEFQNSLTIINSATLQCTNGLIINGIVNLGSLDGSTFGTVNFAGEQSLEGTGTITFGGNLRNAINAATSDGDSGTLTVGAGITIDGNEGSLGSIGLPLVNQGIIAADVGGDTLTIRSSNLSNSGTIEAKNGGTLSSVGGSLSNTGIIEANDTATVSLNNSSVTIDSPGILIVQPSASIKVTGSILGKTTDTSVFEPSGTVSLSGAGTSAIPQFFEVMGQDLGNVPAGFNSNFAFGNLSVGHNDYVRLVDLQRNSGSSNPEALYVNTLVVPSGSTLDLNGLKLYYRAGQINGTVTAGSAIPLLGGGPLLLNSFAPGALQAAGEVDNWSFFGRAGQLVDILLHTGSSGTPAPLQPDLGYGQLTLWDPGGKVVNVASSSQSGADASILNLVLPADGTYQVKVQAAPESPAGVGNYVLAAYDAAINDSAVELNQNAYGQLNSPYSQHRWTFAATANAQIKFDLLAAANSSIKFDLTGPGEYVGFVGFSESSDLITLPTSGTYTVTASGSTGAYAFRLDQTSLLTLTLGNSYQGTLAGSGDAQLFQVDVAQAGPFLVALLDQSAVDQDEVYLKLRNPPTRSAYDYRYSGIASATDIVLTSNAAPGTWYVLVYGASVPDSSNYSLTARSSTVVLTGVTPDHYGTGTDIVLTAAGAGFDSGSQVQLVGADGSTYDADSIGPMSGTQLTATFSGDNIPSRIYSVVVTTGTGDSAELPDSLTIHGAAQQQLKTSVIVPFFVGYHQASTLYVDYSNTGTTAIEAPLLLLTATQNGRSAALMTLDPTFAGQGFNTSTLPTGLSNEIQILASGSTPGYLLPGESIQVPVYYAGWEQPWDSTYPPIQFNLSVYTADNGTPIDWSQEESLMRPAGLDDQTWNDLFGLIQVYAGPTWGSYISALSAAVQQSAPSSSATTPTVQQAWQGVLALAAQGGQNPGYKGSTSTDVDTTENGVLFQGIYSGYYVLYQNELRWGGRSHAWRNNNPGNMQNNAFTMSHGSIGQDDGAFAIFPDPTTGWKAMDQRLTSTTVPITEGKYKGQLYPNLTIADAIESWAPSSAGNNTTQYQADVQAALDQYGIDDTVVKVKELTAAERNQFEVAIAIDEGWSDANQPPTSGPQGGYHDPSVSDMSLGPWLVYHRGDPNNPYWVKVLFGDEPPLQNPPGPNPPYFPVPPMGPPGGGGPSPTVGSHDPNASIGPAGFGTSHFITPDTLLPYQVDFENSPSATAPAQLVMITDSLDPNLDWKTLQLTGVGFGDTNIVIPANSQYFATTLPITENGKSFDVEIEIDFSSGTGLLTATIQSIDPSTQLPPDILTGFLPPEDGTGRGMGYISFIVDPRSGLPTGAELHNVALITFDANPAIATNQVNDDDPAEGVDPEKQDLNTIDSGPPTSSVAPLPVTETSSGFTVAWSSTDNPGGSGIAFYNVYVSDDGGPYSLWQTDTTLTSATFTGAYGHTYSFFSTATDNVGNVEETPAAAEATTRIVGSSVTTTTTPKPSENSPTYGDSLTFTVTVAPDPSQPGTPTGSVQFIVDGADLGFPVALTSGIATTPATKKLTAGAHAISAVYSGDSTFTNSPAGDLHLIIAKAPVAVTADNKFKIYGDPDPTLTYTVVGLLNGDVSICHQRRETIHDDRHGSDCRHAPDHRHRRHRSQLHDHRCPRHVNRDSVNLTTTAARDDDPRPTVDQQETPRDPDRRHAERPGERH